ncbi:MAG TPA: hypothetical protein VGM69_04320 [Chloroflexota bacterium]|jgi:hypothetical protein
MSQRRRRRAPVAQRVFAILALLVVLSMVLALVLPSLLRGGP